MRLEPKFCPCGCGKVTLDPLCRCQCSSVTPEQAHELSVIVNRHQDLMAAVEFVAFNRPCPAGQEMARTVFDLVKAELAGKPSFGRFPWDNRKEGL